MLLPLLSRTEGPFCGLTESSTETAKAEGDLHGPQAAQCQGLETLCLFHTNAISR